MWDQPGVYKDYSLYLKNILEYWIKGQGNKINVDGNKTLHQWVSFQENFSGDIFLIRIFIFFLVFFYAPQDPIKSLKKHVYKVFDEIFTPYLNASLLCVWRNVYTMFEVMFTTYIKTYLHVGKCLQRVLRHVYTMF